MLTMLGWTSTSLTEPNPEQEAFCGVPLKFGAVLPWFPHVTRYCAYLDLESRVTCKVKMHEVPTIST